MLDLRSDETNFAGTELGDILHFRAEDADFVDRIMRIGRHHFDLLALLQSAIDDAHNDNDTQICVVIRVNQKRLQGRSLVTLWRGQTFHNSFEHKVDTNAGLGRDRHSVRRINADDFFNLFFDAIGLSGRQINLVQHRHNLMSRVERVIDIGERLGFDTLRGVDDKERSFASCQRTRDFVSKVDVAGRIHQVQNIGLAVERLIFEANGLGFDGDAALTLDVH